MSPKWLKMGPNGSKWLSIGSIGTKTNQAQPRPKPRSSGQGLDLWSFFKPKGPVAVNVCLDAKGRYFLCEVLLQFYLYILWATSVTHFLEALIHPLNN